MDIKDVSTVAEYFPHMRQALANAEAAHLTKGQVPRNFASAQALTQSFNMKLRLSNNSLMQSNLQRSRHLWYTSQVPEPYAPCTLPATNLEPILITQMRLETHHRGRSIVVRILTPPDRMTAVMAIVEDIQGTAALLQLYHQPPEDVVPAAALIKRGGILLLKEPYLKKATSDGTLSLRVDHVSDVIPLDEADELVPPKWRKVQGVSTSKGASAKLREQGNKAVGKKMWAEAEQLYTQAIKAAQTTEEEQLAVLNRSLADLRLGRPAVALSDAVRAEELSKNTSEKALFRKASALYELRKFDECLSTLDELSASFPSNETSTTMLPRVKARLREQNTGEYDFKSMRKQAARSTPPLVDVATYSAPVEIRSSPQRGRGLFTTRKVVAGELLVCEKALGYKYADHDHMGSTTLLMNVTTRRMTMGGQADVLMQLVQKLYHDPELSRAFAGAYHGDYNAVFAPDLVDGKPVVDTFHVERVLALTGFGSPRASQGRALFSNDNTDSDSKSYSTSGVYPLIGHMNHACLKNTQRSFIGDVQIVRAARDMEADTELLFWYKPPEEYKSYAETQAGLASWGFQCQCALCLAKKAWSAQEMRTRQGLREQLERAMSVPGMGNARQVLNRMEATYSAAERTPGAVRLELWDPCIALGALLLQSGKPADAIEVTLQGLEALGFIIVAAPPRKKQRPAQQNELSVKQWGLPGDYTPAAFHTLFQAYKQLCPPLAVSAKEYAITAFSIVVGDTSTVGDLFPELAQD